MWISSKEIRKNLIEKVKKMLFPCLISCLSYITGELLGFVDLGDVDRNYSNLKDVKELASHVLVLMVKSIVNPLSFSIATFATHGVSGFQLYTIFWRAVALLEIKCQLKVIATTADGASANRRLINMHRVI